MTVMLAMVTLLAGLVLIAVLASTVRALAMASANSRLRRDGVRATGTVVDNTMTSTPQRQLLFSPVVEFHARTGELVSAPAQQRAARSWPRGSTVEIAYDPAEPYRFVLAGEPVETGVVVAVDRSASVHWAMEGTALAQVVAGLQTSFSRALTPDARVRWFTHGSSSSDADGPVPIATADLTAEANLAKDHHPIIQPSPSTSTGNCHTDR